MRSPWRSVQTWIDDRRLTSNRLEAEAELSTVLQRTIRLLPVGSGGGHDRIYAATCLVGKNAMNQGRGGTENRLPIPHSPAERTVFAMVRMVIPWRCHNPKEILACRQPLAAAQRLQREATVYRQLARHGITPHLTMTGANFIANQFLPWQRLRELLKRDGRLVWDLLPRILKTMRRMHRAGHVHLDLNCGNILVSPDHTAVRFIDFEYVPTSACSSAQLQAFDLLRLLHNLLKPRRGRTSLLADPSRLVGLLASHGSHLIGSCGKGLPANGFHRVQQSGQLFDDLQHLLTHVRPDMAKPVLQAAGSAVLSDLLSAALSHGSVARR